jgi:hypothetical protein
MSSAKTKAVQRTAQRLFRAHPGAGFGVSIPTDAEGHELWGEVEATAEWRFCLEIARLIIENSGATFVNPD